MCKKLYSKLILILLLISVLMFFGNGNIDKVYAEEISNTEITKLKGDFNGDGKKDVTDLLIMLRHIATTKNESVKQKYPQWYKDEQKDDMDINKDGKVDVTDCLMLQRHIAANKNKDLAFKHPEWLIKDVVPEELELNIKETATICLDENNELQLIPYITSTNEEIFTDLTWESSNPNVATVNSSGKVTGINEGTCTIKVTAKNGKEATCEITVKKLVTEISPEIIKLNNSKIELELKETKNVKLDYRISPSNANTNTQVKWISSNPEIVEVDDQGKLTPKSEGNATITVQTENGKTATCDVLVKNTNQVTDIYPESLINDTPEIKIILNQNAYSEMKTHINPSNANCATTITYSSSDSSIVQVDNAGILRGIKEGTCTITATTENGKTTQTIVTVENGKISPESVTINVQGPIELEVNKTVQLSAVIAPDNANIDTGLKWVSSNSNIAVVNSNGLVTAKGEGSCTIAVTTDNGKTADITINVKNSSSSSTIAPQSVSIKAQGSTQIEVGKTVQLSAVIEPNNANVNTQLTWESSNSSIATVSNNGVVTGVKEGNCTITVRTTNGKTANIAITVKNNSSTIAPQNVSIRAQGSTQIEVGKTVQLSAVITPSNSNIDTQLTWESNNSSIATVNNNGLVAGKKEGSCTITVRTANEKTANIAITVKNSITNIAPQSVSIKAQGSTQIEVGKTVQLSAVIEPSNANVDTQLIWQSNNSSIAVINSNGVVTGVKEGSCTITVRTANGKTASITITVKNTTISPQSVTINAQGSTTLKVNNTVQLNATILPSNANANTTLTWQSSNSSIATVSSSGLVTARRTGNCAITVRTANGKTASVVITVQSNDISPTSVSIQSTTTTVEVNKSIQLNAVISPSDANSNTALAWQSSNKSIATVNSNGVVTGVKEGTCTITVITANGKVSSCYITVKDSIILPESVSIRAEGSTTLTVNQTVKLNAIITPNNVTNSTVIWTSSNSNIATVNNQGLVQAKNVGSCTITVKTSNNKTSTCIITVIDNVAPKIEITASYGNQYIITGGTTITYDINIVESNSVKSFDTNKIQLTGDLKDKVVKSVTKQNDKKYTVTIKVPDEVGRLGIKIDAGAAVDNSGQKSNEARFHEIDDYVFTLNETTSNGYITAAVGVINSFYVKSYDFWLDNVKKASEITTNEYTYSGLTTGNTYKVKVVVDVYIDKETDTTVSGTLEKSVRVDNNSGVEVHFINVSEGDGRADCMFIKTKTGKTIMIDTGSYQHDEYKIKVKDIDKYLRKDKKLVTASNGIVKIDYLILTHEHGDHVGGFRKLAGIKYKETAPGYEEEPENTIDGEKVRYDFGKIILGCNVQQYKEDDKPSTDTTEKCKAIYCYAKNTNKLMTVTAGNVLKIDNIVLNIFNPYKEADVPSDWISSIGKDGIRQKAQTTGPSGTTFETSMSRLNNNSIVTKLICGSRKVLFMGDAEFYIEEILLGIPAKQVTNNDVAQKSGLTIHSSNGGGNKDSKKLTSYISLVYDLVGNGNKYEDCKNIAELEKKYKLSRLTAKNLDAQILKKGHHDVRNTTSVPFLNVVSPYKIVSTGKTYPKSTISCVDAGPDYRIRTYYATEGNGTPSGNALEITSSNWKRQIFGTVTHGSFGIVTENGTSWNYDDAYGKIK